MPQDPIPPFNEWLKTRKPSSPDIPSFEEFQIKRVEAEVGKARTQFEQAQKAYVSAGGKILNPTPEASFPGSYRQLTSTEKAAQQRGEPVIISEAGQAPPVAPQTPSRPRKTGILKQGNVDLTNRPRVKNRDGSTSTVRSISVNMDGREVLLPTVSDDGRILTEKQAIEQYRKTGKHLGIFDNPASATTYAQKLHENQARTLQTPPVSLEPVIQSRMGQIEREKRQRETQQKVEQARQVMQRRQGLVLPQGQRNQGAAYQPKFGMGQSYREIPKIDKTIPNLAEVAAEKPLTFAEDRAQREATMAAMDRLRGRQGAASDFTGEEYQNFLRMNRSFDSPKMREDYLTLRAKQQIAQHGSIAGALLSEDEESARRERIAKMGTGEYLGQIPKSAVGGLTGGVGTSLKGLAVASKKIADQIMDTRGLEARDTDVYRLGEYITQLGKDNPLFKSNPDLEKEFFVGKAPDTIGQSVTFLLGGWASKSPKLAVSVLGGVMTAGDAYDEVRSLGGSDEDAVNAGLIAGGLLGPTELFGMRGAIKALEGTVAETTLKAALKTALREGSRDVIENALQEVGQEAGQGLITGNPRSLEQLAEAGLLGSVGGLQTVPTSLGASAIESARSSRAVAEYIKQSPLSTPEEKAAAEQSSTPPSVETKEVKPVSRPQEASSSTSSPSAEDVTEKPSNIEPIVEKPLQIAMAPTSAAKPQDIIPELSGDPVGSARQRYIASSTELFGIDTQLMDAQRSGITETQVKDLREQRQAPFKEAFEAQRQLRDLGYTITPVGELKPIPKEPAEAPPAEIKPQPSATESQLTTPKEVTDAVVEPSAVEAIKPTSIQAPEGEASPVKTKPETAIQPEVASFTSSSEEAKRAILAKLTDWGTRLKTIAQSKNLDDLQVLSDEMAAHKDDPRVARLRTAIQDELARARQPEIPERAPEQAVAPKPTSKAAQKTFAQAESPEGKTIRPAPTHRIGAPRIDASRNSLEQQVRAYGGVKDDVSQAYKGELGWLKESGKRGTINQTGGVSVEEMATKLAQDGYGKGVWWEDAPNNVDPQAFLQAVMDDTRGTRQYSTERDEIEDDPDVKAWDALVEGTGAELIERVQSGRATAADIVTLTREAGANGLSDQALDTFIASVQRTVKEELSGGSEGATETTGGYSLDEDGTLLDPDGSPLFAREFQLGFMDAGLTAQQAAPAKDTKQREQLLREQQERDEAADPLRAAALRVLADIRRRGMSVDEYARQGDLFGPGPSADEIKLLKELERKQPKPESGQSSMFAKGETAETSPFGVEGNRVSLNQQGAQLISEIYRELGYAKGKEQIRGTFERQGAGLARNLDKLADRGREGASELAQAVREAVANGDGKVVLFFGEGAKRHELFHEASEKGYGSLRGRHGDFESLTKTPEFTKMYYRLVAIGYPKFDMGVLVEEAAAHIAEGRYEQLGLTREEAIDWMYKWFQSFEKANPQVNPRQFQEMSDEAEQARQRVYNTQSRVFPEPRQDVSRLQEGRETGDREYVAAARESGETKAYPIADRGEWYSNSDYKARGGRIVEMSPDEFLAEAKPLEIDEGSRDNIDDLKRHIESGRTLDPAALYADGKTDGRHRAIASKELGIESIPVIDFRDNPNILMARSENDYQGEHAPADAESGAPLHDLTANGIYPNDVYGPNGLRYYPSGYDALDSEAYSLLQSYRDHPGRVITIYRAVPRDAKGSIRPGDWVTPIRRYAVEHGKDNLGGDFKIQKKMVTAHDIFTDGNSWLEWGYDPQPFNAQAEKDARERRRKRARGDETPLFARSGDPWANLSDLADEFEQIAGEPELALGEKPRSLPKTLDGAGLESGPTKGYIPESIVDDGLERAKQVISDKGIDGAMEFVRSGDGIEWASTGYEVSARLRAQESELRAEGKTDEADTINKKRLDFLDDFAAGAVERGRSIVGIKAISEFSPDRMAYALNKASLKKRKHGISAEEEAKIAKLGEELGALEERNKTLQKALDEATARARVTSSQKGGKPKKTDYQSRLDQQASVVLQTLKPKVGKLDLAGLDRESERGAVKVGIPPLPGDAELIAQYAAAQLAKQNTVADLNQHLVQEFGQDIEQYLPKIRQRAYAVRSEARQSEIEASETEPKRRKTILSEIQKEIAESLTAIREAQKAQEAARKAERAAEAKSERTEARSEARRAREQASEEKKQVIKEARADLKRLREEMKQASRAESAGYRETIKTQREAARKAELWDTPIRNEASASRERLKDATDIKDPQVVEDLVNIAAEKFLPEKEGGTPRTGAIEPARVYRDLKDEFPALVTKKNQADIYKRGYQRIQDATAAAREAARLRSATAESKRLWEELGEDVDAQAVLIRQAEVRRQTDELRRKAVAEFDRVNKTMLEKIWMEAQAIPRSLQSSIDSPIGRQGWFFVLTHPVSTLKVAIPATVQGYGSIKTSDYAQAESDLRKHPDYQLAQQADLDLTEISSSADPALQAEEQFQSQLATKYLPHVRLSEQGYVLTMNAIRLTHFSRLAALGKAEGYTFEGKPEFFQQAAAFVNNASGRGTMPEALKRASALLNIFFFSTRLNISRIQLINDMVNPAKYLSYDPVMRKAVALETVRLARGLAIVFATAAALGLKLEFDPDDPDSFLIRFRNTRYDITGGEAGTVRFLYRMFKSIGKMATGQEIERHEEPTNQALKFLRYKLAPLPAGIIDALTGKDAVGQPANLRKFDSPKQVFQQNVIIKRLFPMVAGQFVDTVSEEGWIGVPMTLPALAGFGVSSYPDRGIRAIKNQTVVDELENLKITSQSLLGPSTKDDDLDKAINSRIMAEVEKLEIPQGATEVGKEKLIRERLSQIRALARAEAAVAEPKRYAEFLKRKDGNESLSFLTDDEKKTLTEADLKAHRDRYADEYVKLIQRAASAQEYQALSDDEKQKVLARVGRIAHTLAKVEMVKSKRK